MLRTIRALAWEFLPFFLGGAIIFSVVMRLTRTGTWPNFTYHIIELDLFIRIVALAGVISLGMGVGAILAAMFRTIHEGEFLSSSAEKHQFVWENRKLTNCLVIFGLALIAVVLIFHSVY